MPAPTISVDKTAGCQLFLSQESLTTSVTTAKSSEINVLVPNDDGDWCEDSLPQQFIHEFKDGQFTTTPVSHSGVFGMSLMEKPDGRLMLGVLASPSLIYFMLTYVQVGIAPSPQLALQQHVFDQMVVWSGRWDFERKSSRHALTPVSHYPSEITCFKYRHRAYVGLLFVSCFTKRGLNVIQQAQSRIGKTATFSAAAGL